MRTVIKSIIIQFLSNFFMHELNLQKPSTMLRGNNHSRGTLFPGVGATGGGGGKSIRIKQQQRYKKWIKKRRVRVILLLVVLLSACSFFLNNAFHGILNRQNDENEKSMRKVNSHYAKVDRHSRRERKQMQREVLKIGCGDPSRVAKYG